MTEPVRNISTILQELAQAKRQREVVQAQVSQMDRDIADIENELMAEMHKAGVDTVKGAGLTAIVSRSTVAQVKDWQAFERYVHRHKAFHLFERRVHTKAWREECDGLGENVPGTEPFERIRLTTKSS